MITVFQQDEEAATMSFTIDLMKTSDFDPAKHLQDGGPVSELYVDGTDYLTIINTFDCIPKNKMAVKGRWFGSDAEFIFHNLEYTL